MSSLARSTYHLGSPTRTCAATGRPLATGEPYVAALVQDVAPGTEPAAGAASPGPAPTDEFRRIDFSLEAWKSGARPTAPDGRRLPVLGSWRGTMPEPGARRRILIDDDALIELFEQSGEDQPAPEGDNATPVSPEDRRTFRYLLALILIRKKLLICEKTDRRGTMHVRPRGSPRSSEGGTLIPVEDPGLSEESAARVMLQLSAVLDGEPAAAAPSTSVEAKP